MKLISLIIFIVGILSIGLVSSISWSGGETVSIAGGLESGGEYLYNDSTTIYFNDTLLNSTIDNRSVSSGGTGGNVSNLSQLDDTTIDDTATSDDDVLAWDTTTDSWITKAINTIIDFLTKAQVDSRIESNYTNLQSKIKNADDDFLYNDTNTIYLNSTKLNETITNLSGTGGATQDGIWENVSGVANFDGNINFSNMTMESKTEYSVSEIYVEVNSTTYAIWL